MLEINKVNKYFNKGKKNQLHVINNTTLSLDSKGLIALLGPSGCGKTTLLNVIGGLDKIKSGSIYVNGEKISSRSQRKVDKIRNLNVGYIFQDYKLIDHLSVYENVALVLKMLGIKDKQEIKKRVEYVLEKVGMLRYQRRPAVMLSGGERQRVGIARAIVKDPNIILADEPTGNLDSKNTLEIMNIIKAISKDRLVILVTHEQNLAKFYASRIIEIEDGTIIKDYENQHDDELDYQIDNRFYLKDFDQVDELKGQNDNIKIYRNNDEKTNLDIVIRNGNIYIKSKDNAKIEVVDETNSIEFLDEHYKKIDRTQVEQYQFNFQDIINSNLKKKYTSILNPFTLLKNGFKRVFDFPILKKILLVGFFLSAMFIMYSISSIAAALTIHEEDFVTVNKDYLIINQTQIKVTDYLAYEQLDNINYLLLGDSRVTFNVSYADYYQTNRSSMGSLSASLSSLDMVQEKDLILGRMPTNDYEVIVDKIALSKMLEQNDSFQMAGLLTPENFLGRKITISHMNDFTIVGITDKKSPSLYVAPNLFINILANSNGESGNHYGAYYEEVDSEKNAETLIDYNLYQEKIELKKGRYPENDYEIIVPQDYQETMPLNKQIDKKVGDTKLTVVGYYESKYGYSYFFTNNNTIKYNLINNAKSITVYPKNKKEVLNYFRDKKINIRDSYKQSKEQYMDSKKEIIKNTLTVSGIILVISLIEIFLMIRSSFLSRIKEIGTFRAIGVKKSDIYKMFSGEIFAITTLAGMPGLILMAYILSVLSNIKYLSNYIVVNPYLILLSIIFVYLFNLIIGLIPIYNTIRKRPAEILARYDLD